MSRTSRLARSWRMLNGGKHLMPTSIGDGLQPQRHRGWLYWKKVKLHTEIRHRIRHRLLLMRSWIFRFIDRSLRNERRKACRAKRQGVGGLRCRRRWVLDHLLGRRLMHGEKESVNDIYGSVGCCWAAAALFGLFVAKWLLLVLCRRVSMDQPQQAEGNELAATAAAIENV